MHVLVCRTVSQCSRCGEAKEGWRVIQGFLLYLELTMFLLGWWSSEPQDCLSLPSPPVIGTSSHAQFLCGLWGFRLRSSCWPARALSHHLPKARSGRFTAIKDLRLYIPILQEASKFETFKGAKHLHAFGKLILDCYGSPEWSDLPFLLTSIVSYLYHLLKKCPVQKERVHFDRVRPLQQEEHWSTS